MSDYNRVSRIWRDVAIGAIAGWSVLIGVNIYEEAHGKKIPCTTHVQKGFVIPNELEIRCQD